MDYVTLCLALLAIGELIIAAYMWAWIDHMKYNAVMDRDAAKTIDFDRNRRLYNAEQRITALENCLRGMGGLPMYEGA